MPGSSDDIAALLTAVTTPDDPAPGQLPAIFRDIVGRLDAASHAYAIIGRIALTLHEQARFVRAIEIVAELGADGPQRAAELVGATQARFASFMDPRCCTKPIRMSLRPCAYTIETQLITEAIPCPWFGVTARLASAEHLLWLWCRSNSLDHAADASALIGGGAVDLQRVQGLLRESDDGAETGQMRLRLAIGDAVLAAAFSFSRFMAERRTRLTSDRVPVPRLDHDPTTDR